MIFRRPSLVGITVLIGTLAVVSFIRPLRGVPEVAMPATQPATPQATAAPITGVVRDGKANPVAGAVVSLVRSSWQSMPIDVRGSFQILKDAPQVTTDAEGRFNFSPTAQPFELAIEHDAGYARVTSTALTASPWITLTPWARLEGVFAIGGKPMAGARLSIEGPRVMSTSESFIQFGKSAQTDAQGHFVFEHVIAEPIQVSYFEGTKFILNNIHFGGARNWPVPALMPGESHTLALGNSGRAVTGKILSPTNSPVVIDYSRLLGSIGGRIDWAEEPETCDDMTMAEREAWKKTPEGQAFDAKRRALSAQWPLGASFFPEADGSFRVEDIPPGDYTLMLNAYGATLPKSRNFEPPPIIASVNARFTVPPVESSPGDAKGAALFDAGTFTLEPNAAPLNPGDAAPLFEVSSIDGKPIRLADYRGKHVLVVFWLRSGTWVMPAIRATSAKYGDRLAIIGLNMDPNKPRGLDYIAKRNPPGVHASIGYFGESRVQLDYFSRGCVPQVFLIGPDGKLIAKDLTAETIEAKVAEAIGK